MTSLPSGLSPEPGACARAAIRRRALPGVVWLVAASTAAGALSAAGPARAGVWSNVNPGGGGAFTCVGAGISGTIIVGSDIGGVYRSDNHGATWENVGSSGGGLIRSYVSSVAFSPSMRFISTSFWP